MPDSVDFINNKATISGKQYDLDVIREHILINNPTLCANSFIRVVRSGGKDVFHYDWLHIFDVAAHAGYLTHFHKSQIANNEQP